MNWELDYLPEVQKDIDDLTRSQQILVGKAIKKVKQNPLPQSEDGYGKPLGHKQGTTNMLKIKLRGEGIRIVYKLIRTETKMLVLVIGVREDEEVYEIAQWRRAKYDL